MKYVEGWKAIAPVVGRSERWCRNMRKRHPRPLPVIRMGGVYRLYLADFESWLRQELTDPGGAAPRSGRAQ